MATDPEKPNAKKPLEENPKKTLDLTVPPAAKPDQDPSQETTDASSIQPSSLQPPDSNATSTTQDSRMEGGESKGVPAVGSVAGSDAPLSDIQKKMRRAERFGISVQLSEVEKRNSRAERFGTGSSLQASVASKSEELKRNARAERFGIPMVADDEAKKKARLARFALVSKTDPLEEDKRKARALRFSNPPLSSLSQANGKGNVEAKAAIAGKDDGGA